MDENNIPKLNIKTILTNAYRILWRQYILWTRIYIINIACDFGNLSFITQRITENIHDFAIEFMEYYGYENSKILELLLDKHFLISVKLVNDFKTGNKELIDDNRILWYDSANDIADFLSSINPNWSKSEWQNMLYEQLPALESEATCRFMSLYEADIKNQEEIENRSLFMANYMAEEIIKQFKL